MLLDIEKEVATLERMTAGQLAERFAELFGDQTHSRHRTYLIRKIAWRLQIREQGDLSERARKRAEELASDAELRVMPPKAMEPRPVTEMVTKAPVTTDPRLPVPGSSLIREYRGHTYEVVVRADGFEFDGERYPSLTAVARKITGTHCNGFCFFKLEGGK